MYRYTHFAHVSIALSLHYTVYPLMCKAWNYVVYILLPLDMASWYD